MPLTVGLCLVLAGGLLLPQGQIQVGYAILAAQPGSLLPVGTALFSYRNSDDVLVAEAAVAAVRPAVSGRVFVQRRGTQTGIAFANPSEQAVDLELSLRGADGGLALTRNLRLGGRQHIAQFIDELFESLPEDFIGSLTYRAADAGAVAAVTLRQSLNSRGEPLLATLPVVDLAPANQPAGAGPTTLIVPHLGAGDGLTTQIILIERSGAPVSGMIRLRGRSGSALTAELDGVAGSDFPFRLPADGVYQGVLDSPAGISQGWALIEVQSGNAPAGVAVFQFRDRQGRLLSEAGIEFATPTRTARIFVDGVQTRTGVALSLPGPSSSIHFRLLDRNGLPLGDTALQLPAGGQTAVFVDELFAGLSGSFTGLLEISAPQPFAPTSLKLSINQRGEPILTTLPVADLDRPFPDSPLVFPQIGFGAGFSTRLILINPPSQSTANLSFRDSGGGSLTVPLSGSSGSTFSLNLAAGAALQLRPGNRLRAAAIVLDPSAPQSFEIAVNREGEVVVRPDVLDESGQPRDDFAVEFSSLDPDVATIDSRGRVRGRKAGFSTLTARAQGVVAVSTIAVVDVSPGAAAFDVGGIALDPAGRLFLSNSADNTVLRAETPLAPPQVYAGRRGVAGLADGRRLEALFSEPRLLAINQADGSLLVADSRNHAIRRILPGLVDRVETLAGTGRPGSRDGAAAEASFFEPSGVALDATGHLWVADSSNHLIRRIDLVNRTVQTVAGAAGFAGSADGVGSQARFNRPLGIALLPEPLSRQLERLLSGEPAPPVRVVVADAGNGALRLVGEDGLVETLAAGSASGASRRGGRGGVASPATAVAADGFGNVFAAGPDGVSVLLANGERVPAAQSGTFNDPRALLAAAGGRLFVADQGGALSLEYGAPRIDQIDPKSVSNRAGSRATIRGRNFSPDTQVVVGGLIIANAVVANTGTIDLELPDLASGRTTVTVQNRGGAAQAPLFVRPTPLSGLQPGLITTVAGGASFIGDGASALEASLFNPEELAVDPGGNVFVADRDNHRVRRVDASTGVITTVAGTGAQLVGFARNDIPAVTAELAFPEKLAVDGGANVFISSFLGGGGLRKVESATGLIRGVSSLSGFHQIAADAFGNLFISRSFENRVLRRDSASGQTQPYAGNGTAGFSGDGGDALSASLNSPQRMAVDSAGNLYIADQRNNRVRRVDAATGRITTAAVVNAGFGPENVALDAAGNLFVGGSGFFGLIRIDASSGASTNLAPSIDSRFLAADAGGNVYYTDKDANQVFRIASGGGAPERYAGSGASSEVGDGGPATAAALTHPVGLALAPNGDLLVADRDGQRIRRVGSATGVISTLAGDGEIGNIQPGDGTPALQASLFFPAEVAADAVGNVYFADSKIWRIDPSTGTLQTAVQVSNARGLEVDSAGNLYFSQGNRVMRRTAQTGAVSTLAGGEQGGFSGDGGPAVSARLQLPSGTAVDRSGNVFVADLFNGRVRRIDAATGIITTVAGGGPVAFGDNRPATEVTLSQPVDVAVDRDGNLYILEPFSIRRVDAATQIITTVARTRSRFSFAGDNGPATQASYDGEQIAVDSEGNLYLTDAHNGRVRAIRRP